MFAFSYKLATWNLITSAFKEQIPMIFLSLNVCTVKLFIFKANIWNELLITDYYWLLFLSKAVNVNASYILHFSDYLQYIKL